jgi:hypothetical protein
MPRVSHAGAHMQHVGLVQRQCRVGQVVGRRRKCLCEVVANQFFLIAHHGLLRGHRVAQGRHCVQDILLPGADSERLKNLSVLRELGEGAGLWIHIRIRIRINFSSLIGIRIQEGKNYPQI